MQKGENIISAALAGVVVLVVLAIQRHWQPAALKDVASSAEEFILTTTGLRGQAPKIPGFETVKTFRVSEHVGGLYRVSPAPAFFAPGRFVLYDRQGRPALTLETLEGSDEPWTTLYDFAARGGVTTPSRGARPVYSRDLAGTGDPEIVIGQYTGGERCCTKVTVLSLGKDSVQALGTLDGLDGVPFQGLEIRRIGGGRDWKLVAHRPYRTICGSRLDAADVLAIYAYSSGKFTEQTLRYLSFLEGVLHQNLARWTQEKQRSLRLLGTMTFEYAMLGQSDQGNQFFSKNLSQFLSVLEKQGVDTGACTADVENLATKLASVAP